MRLRQGCRAVSGETYSVEKAERGIALALAPISKSGGGRTLAPMEALQRELRAQARCLHAAHDWVSGCLGQGRPHCLEPACSGTRCGKMHAARGC